MDSPPRMPPAFFILLLFVSLQTLGCATQDCSGPIHKCNGTIMLEKLTKEHLKGPSSSLLIPSLYLVVIFIGFPANILALWVLIAKTKKMPSNTFLINLTVADLLLILVLPFKIFYHFSGNDWVFGEILCRLMTIFFYGNMYCSILCLTFISIDRYIALVHLFLAKTLPSKKTASYLCIGVWVLVVGAMLPLGLTQQSYSFKEPNITTCHDALLKEDQANFFFPYFASLFAVGFVAPFCIIVFCNCAILRALILSEKRYVYAAKITALVLLVFVVCFAPSSIIQFLHYSEFQMVQNHSDLYRPYMISLALSTFNSCIDPFIYYYISEDFRAKARSTVKCCRKTPYSLGTTSRKTETCSLSQPLKSTVIFCR
ncbi:LOW QUALITY PROTEIN: proteinase-activated receptor 3-like [Polyodon spathula]|uniref:LOW QUALITY PROTEIN: proteinase-activated receptor 3-like n=1 Tax=Polyodon spathula TaxID=7913 RepID=UPI001B7D9991|nr:LOW QUALITY PROTEIN: proteinase-activated receptor 3-like [Polyodon spathula]